MTAFRPILISTIHYQAELLAGTINQLDVARTAQRLGVDGIEFRDIYWQDKAREIGAVPGLLSELGLSATYTSALPLFKVATDGPAAYREAVDDAVAVGSPLVRFFPGAVPAADDDAAWAAAEAIITYAEEQGIRVAVENFAQAPGNMLAEIKRVLDRFPTTALGTNLDIGNYASNGQDVVEAIGVLGPRIIYTHLKDSSTTPSGVDSIELGAGTMPMDAILTAIANLPQPLMHCFEFNGGPDPDARVVASLAYLARYT